jgi:hypothetical protein
MVALAQRIVDGGLIPHDDDHVAPFERLVKAALDPKLSLERQATRIVYEDDLYGALREMVQAEQLDFGMICRNARMPCERLWLEWRDVDASSRKGDLGKVDFGCLILPSPRKDAPGKLMFVVVNMSKTWYGKRLPPAPQVTCIFEADPPPYLTGNPTLSTLLWCMDDKQGAKYDEGLWKELNKLVVRTLVFAIFLLQQPKLIDQTEVRYAPKQNAKRAKHGKPELISYTKTKLKFHILGSNIERRAREGKHVEGVQGNLPDEKRGVRYHYVIGHFRCYHRGQSNEYLVWIEPHYRGDATKGVLIRERVLSKG